MNKLSIAVLLFSSLYLATALTDAPWADLRQGVYENSPFLLGLNNIGGQNVLGQALESGLFNNAQGEVGKLFNAWYQRDERGFTYIGEPQLVMDDGSLHNSKYGVRVDPETGRRDVVYWSVQQLLEENNLPTGRNITWNAETDAVTVTDFDGIDQFLQYQGFQPLNNSTDDSDADVVVDSPENAEVDVDAPEDADVEVNDNDNDNNDDVVVDAPEDTEVNVDAPEDTDVVVNPNDTNNTANASEPNVQVFNSWADYLRDYVGYQPEDPTAYNQDEFLTNAVNNAIGQVGDTGNLPNLALNNVNSLDTLAREGENTLVRLTGEVTSDTTSGTLVAVMSCAAGGNCDDGALQHWYWNSFQSV